MFGQIGVPTRSSLIDTRQEECIFLQPGELVTSATPVRVKTVVGSCLAIMIRAPRLGLAAVAHCLLPKAGVPVETLPREQALRYVDATLELILEMLARRGARGADLEIKLFGGAEGLGGPGTASIYNVGSRNVAAASGLLAEHGLTVAASCLGGSTGRVLEFDTETGDVFVQKLPARLAHNRWESS